MYEFQSAERVISPTRLMKLGLRPIQQPRSSVMIVNPPRPIQFMQRRFANRADAEHIQVFIRIVIVSVVMIYIHSIDVADNASNAEYAPIARWAVSFAFVITITLFIPILIQPQVLVLRRTIGLDHDVAAMYLWVTLGNGFRCGIAYLYGCAV